MWASGRSAGASRFSPRADVGADVGGLSQPMSVPVQMWWGEPYLGGAVAGVSRFGPGADVGGMRPIWEGEGVSPVLSGIWASGGPQGIPAGKLLAPAMPSLWNSRPSLTLPSANPSSNAEFSLGADVAAMSPVPVQM